MVQVRCTAPTAQIASPRHLCPALLRPADSRPGNETLLLTKLSQLSARLMYRSGIFVLLVGSISIQILSSPRFKLICMPAKNGLTQPSTRLAGHTWRLVSEIVQVILVPSAKRTLGSNRALFRSPRFSKHFDSFAVLCLSCTNRHLIRSHHTASTGRQQERPRRGHTTRCPTKQRILPYLSSKREILYGRD